MTKGLSTRGVNTPIGTAGQFSPGKTPNDVVPLSVFFLNDKAGEGQAAKDDGITGLLKKNGGKGSRKSSGADAKKQNKKQTKKNRKVDKNSDGQVSGGDDASVQSANGGAQASAPGTPQESITMATGTPLIGPGGPVKHGATHASIGATGTGNIATAPVPIGEPLRRTKRKGKRKKKKQESLDGWIGRLSQIKG